MPGVGAFGVEANGTLGNAVELSGVLGTGTFATELPGVLWSGVEVLGGAGASSYAEEVWVGACTGEVPEAVGIGASNADLWKQREMNY